MLFALEQNSSVLNAPQREGRRPESQNHTAEPSRRETILPCNSQFVRK